MNTITKDTKEKVSKSLSKNNKSLDIPSAQRYARTIKKISGIDLFHKTRVRENVYMRCIFNHALYNTYNWGLSKIAKFYRDNGYERYDHTTVWHSISMFDIYVKYEPNLLQIYQTVCEAQDDRNGFLTSINIKLQDLSKSDLKKIDWMVNRYYKKDE